MKVDPALFAKYSWAGRSIKYHRSQLREVYGTRPPTEDDEDRWTQWLAAELCPAETNRDRLAAALRRRCRSEKVEPPSTGQVERVVASAGRRFDDDFAATAAGRLGPVVCGRLEDLLRIGGSLLGGYVSAALLVSRLQAGSRQHPLAKALLEYGKLLRTAHALRWFTDEAFRRRIGRQLNRGETLNELRRFIFYAHRGQILHRRHEDQTMQAHCHTLVVNACILSTTWYLHDAVDADRAAGHEIGDATIAHLTPARFEAINPYGLLTFEVAKILNRTNRRPLRTL